MTTNRDFDRLARAWLDLMPDEAPGRLIDNVRVAVDVTPQHGQWRRLINRRPLRASPRLALIAATAMLALALFGSFLLGSAWPSPTAPGPTSSAAPSASAPDFASLGAGTDLPDDLVAGWYGGARDLPGLASGAGTFLLLQPDEARLSQSDTKDAPILHELASMVDGRLQLVTRVPETYADSTCAPGTTGSYDVAMSASGRTLTIQPFSDPCSGRASVVAGTWWKLACATDGADCYGDLDAGTYATQDFDPRVDPGGQWVPNYGALTFTVPDGWAFAADHEEFMRLTPDYAGERANGGVPTLLEGDILVVAQPYPTVGGGTCNASIPPLDTPRSLSDIVSFLEAQPWIDTSQPATTLLDGHVVTSLDLAITPGTTPGCQGDTIPSGEYLTAWSASSWRLGFSGEQRAHLWLIDLGGGDVVAVVVHGRDEPALDGFVRAATPVIESFRFE
jgi:hypothetical protein